MTDTSPAVGDLYRGLLMERSGAERLRMGCEMFDFARSLMLAGVRSGGHSQAGDERIALFLRTYSRDLDPQTIARVVGRLDNRSIDADEDSTI